MRWSWPAFSAGTAMGAVLVLLLAGGTCADDPAPPPADRAAMPVGAATSHGVESGSATRAESPPASRRRTRAEAPAAAPASDESPATESSEHPETTEPAAPESDLGAAKSTVLTFSAERASFQTTGVVLRINSTSLQALGADFVDFSVQTQVNTPVAQGLARARASAEAIVAGGGGSSDADVDSLLRSSDDGDREAAIGLAARAQPPMMAKLLATARDLKVGGSVRATALVAAADAAPSDPAVGEAVAALAADRDVTVRRTAIELLPRFPKQGGERAIAILRGGNYTAELLDPLARTVASSDRAAEFLFANPPPDAAFAVIEALGPTHPVDETARARLLARLPDAIRPLLGLPEMLAHAGGVFGAAGHAGHVVFLRSVAVSPSLPTALRLAAVDAAIGSPECVDGRAALLASALADGRSPVEFLRAVLSRVPAGDVADGGVKSSIAALAESHPNEWLREEARAKLQASPLRFDAGGLKILSGIYGKDGKTVDVTAVLQSMVVAGRLVVEAGNALAGDPLFGVVKDLSVTYEWKGERRTRTIHEYETLTLP